MRRSIKSPTLLCSYCSTQHAAAGGLQSANSNTRYVEGDDILKIHDCIYIITFICWLSVQRLRENANWRFYVSLLRRLGIHLHFLNCIIVYYSQLFLVASIFPIMNTCSFIQANNSSQFVYHHIVLILVQRRICLQIFVIDFRLSNVKRRSTLRQQVWGGQVQLIHYQSSWHLCLYLINF